MSIVSGVFLRPPRGPQAFHPIRLSSAMPMIPAGIPVPLGPQRRRAGDGNRTHVACLEGRYSTIELHPRLASVGSRQILIVRGREELGVRRLDGPAGIEDGSHPSCVPSGPTWVEQDSNLRRHCHQIYSLAPLAAWVSTRDFDRSRINLRPVPFYDFQSFERHAHPGRDGFRGRASGES
jgi:hypothetical protein